MSLRRSFRFQFAVETLSPEVLNSLVNLSVQRLRHRLYMPAAIRGAGASSPMCEDDHDDDPIAK
jgi:hypothetical protein